MRGLFDLLLAFRSEIPAQTHGDGACGEFCQAGEDHDSVATLALLCFFKS